MPEDDFQTLARTLDGPRSRAFEAQLAHKARLCLLGEMSASISHEVNQPLAAISIAAEASLRWLALEELDRGEVSSLLRGVVEDARRASDVVAKIRQFAANRAVERKGLELNVLIEHTMALLKSEIDANGVTVALALCPKAPVVAADKVQMQQVIVNLAINALRAMADQPTGRRVLRIASVSKAETGSVSIEDSGPGISPGVFAHIFDSFVSTRPDGLGLGLSLVKSIVEAHEGRVRAYRSKDLGGAGFEFTLPLY